jgi:predicted dehydrogenase
MAGAAGCAMGVHVSGAAAQQKDSPNERINIAAVGATGRAGSDIAGVASQNIIAIADVDSQLLDKGAAKYARAKKYTDFRNMLDKEAARIDAVVVGTPDHTHAPAAAMALRLKKHVYCEKPLTHTVHESRVLATLAKAGNLITQMGNQIHAGENYRQVVELIKTGAIGSVKRVHVWASARYSGAKFTPAEQPEHVNWDLWLGPSAERAYCAGVHPFKWRSFWDYGTGALGDFGCHYMDLAHWALDLRGPKTIEAQGPAVEKVSTPQWCIVDYQYPVRGELPPVHLTWYDSGKRPEIATKLKTTEGKPLNLTSAQLFIGSKAILLSNYSSHYLIDPETLTAQPIEKRPEPFVPRSIGHHAEWLHGIKTGEMTTCNFDYAGALTEAVLLGTVAYRSGKQLKWDAKGFKVVNHPDVNPLLHKEYRKGWKL